jgi:hypothetical protein
MVRGNRGTAYDLSGVLIWVVVGGLLLASAGKPPATPEVQGSPQAFDPSPLLGLYVIGGQRPVRAWTAVLEQSTVTGVSLSAEWSALEPQPDQLDLASLEARLERVEGAGKRVALRLLPGVSTPKWVYERGAQRFTFIDRNPNHTAEHYPEGHRNRTYGESLAIPVPWDETFLSAWEGFVAMVGSRLGGVPAVAMVHVTGPNKHSAEMILPRAPEDRSRWREIGYSPEKLTRSWQRCIDAFAKAFPRAALVLDLSPAVFDDGVVEAVVAYGHAQYGKRLFLQNNILLADQRRGRLDWGILERYAREAVIGFQRQPLRLDRGSIGREERRRLRRANFEGMLRAGLDLGASYFELGAGDVKDFPDIAETAAAVLARRAGRSR